MSLNETKTQGTSVDANIFGDAEVSAQAITNYHILEKTKNISFDFSKIFKLDDKWSLEIGPSLNFTSQDDKVIEDSNQNILARSNNFKKSIGAIAGVEFDINKRFGLNLNYRHFRTQDRKVNTFGLSFVTQINP